MSWRRKGGGRVESFLYGSGLTNHGSADDSLRLGTRTSIHRRQELGQAPPIAHCSRHTMLRQQLIRSLKRPAAKAGYNGSRTFAVSARRPAEVEITVGRWHSSARAATSANKLHRWKEGFN